MKRCVICGTPLEGYGNNPAPIKEKGRCCDLCDSMVVIPARIRMLFGTPEVEEEIRSASIESVKRYRRRVK